MKSILKRILERASAKGNDFEPSPELLAEAWPELVGEKLAEATRPTNVDWEEERLTIEVPSEAWQRELRRHDHKLLNRLAKVLPWSIHTLEISVGQFESAPRAHPGEQHSEPGPADPRDDETTDVDHNVESSLASLSDSTASTARNILKHVRDGES